MTNADTSVVIIGNFDVLPTEMDPQFQHTGTWYDFFSGNEFSVTDVNALISLGPGQFHIYTDKKLHTPKQDIITGIEKSRINTDIALYPNPTRQFLHINVLDRQLLSSRQPWSIIDIFGREVMTGRATELQGARLDVGHLPTGIYTFILSQNTDNNYIKFIKE